MKANLKYPVHWFITRITASWVMLKWSLLRRNLAVVSRLGSTRYGSNHFNSVQFRLWNGQAPAGKARRSPFRSISKLLPERLKERISTSETSPPRTAHEAPGKEIRYNMNDDGYG